LNQQTTPALAVILSQIFSYFVRNTSFERYLFLFAANLRREKSQFGNQDRFSVVLRGGGPPLAALLWGRHYGLCCRI